MADTEPDAPFEQLRERIRALLALADPDRDWYCRVHAGEGDAPDELQVFCKIDGLTLGNLIELPQADRPHDQQLQWVNSMAVRVVGRSLGMAARMN